MGIRRGSISTPIIADGLLTNFDASNLASTTPSSATTIIKNTINLDNNGTFGATGAYDASNKCFDWDDTVNMQLDTAIDLGTEYTYCAWINPTAWAGEPIGGNTVGSVYMMYLNDATNFYHNTGGGNYVLVPHGLSLSTWVYFSFTRKNSSIKVYQNGALLGSHTIGGNNSMSVRNFGTETGANYYYDGKQDNMNLYNRALSADEILHNYNALKSRFE